jgi:hypothetical protein
LLDSRETHSVRRNLESLGAFFMSGLSVGLLAIGAIDLILRRGSTPAMILSASRGGRRCRGRGLCCGQVVRIRR